MKVGAVVRKQGKIFLREADALGAAKLEGGLRSAGVSLAEQIGQAAPVGLGGLKASLQPAGFGLSRSVRMDAPYAVPADLGSRAHPSPISPLAQWVSAKIGLSGRAAIRMAVAISRTQGGETRVGRFLRTFGGAADPKKLKKLQRAEAKRAGKAASQGVAYAPRIQRNEFFYSTFRRVQADLLAAHIGPVVPQIIEALQ